MNPDFDSAPALRPPVPEPRRLVTMIVFALIILTPYWNIVLLHQSLVPSANCHPFDVPYRHLKMGGLSTSPTLNWNDLGGTWWMWEPAAKWLSKSLRGGTIPLWDPFIAGGIDAHVTVTNSQYFPPYLLLLLLGDTPLQRDLYYLLLLAVAGACCYRLARRWDLHRIASLVFTACFVWSGALTLNVNSIVGQATAMLPLMLLAADWLADRPNAFRIGASALILAGAALSSFLPVVAFGYLLASFLVAVRALMDSSQPGARWRGAAIRAGAFLASAALSIAAIAFLLIPVQLAAAASPVFNNWYRQTGLHYIRFDYLFSLVSPTVTYNSYWIHDARGDLFAQPWPGPNAAFYYAGLTPLFLLVMLRRGRTLRQRMALVFCATAAAFFLLKLLGIPPAQWAGHLPALRNIHFNPYACGALTLALSGLAALSVEGLLRSRPPANRIAAAAAALLAFFLLLINFALTHPLNSAADLPMLLRAAMHNILEAARLGLLAGALLVVFILRRRRISPAAAGWLILAVIGMELVPLAFHIRFERADVWSDPPGYVRLLQSDRSLFRIHSVNELALTPNVFEGLGLSAISARAPFTSSRYYDLIRTYYETRPTPYPLPAGLLPSARVIADLLNVKYLITTTGAGDEIRQLTQAGLEPAGGGGHFLIFRNPSVWPRAFIPQSFEVAASPAEALAATGRLNGPGHAVLEEKPSTAAASAQGVAEITGYQPNRVSIRTRSTTPGLLVLLDNAAPGWTAFVNQTPARILTANYAFRAVEIPAGTAQVEFRYRTPGLSAGLGVSGLSVLLSVLLMTPIGRRLWPAL